MTVCASRLVFGARELLGRLSVSSVTDLLSLTYVGASANTDITALLTWKQNRTNSTPLFLHQWNGQLEFFYLYFSKQSLQIYLLFANMLIYSEVLEGGGQCVGIAVCNCKKPGKNTLEKLIAIITVLCISSTQIWTYISTFHCETLSSQANKQTAATLVTITNTYKIDFFYHVYILLASQFD